MLAVLTTAVALVRGTDALVAGTVALLAGTDALLAGTDALLAGTEALLTVTGTDEVRTVAEVGAWICPSEIYKHSQPSALFPMVLCCPLSPG